MDNERFVVLQPGDDRGNNMIVRAMLSSGREIFGFATENVYGGAWDVGPTWNWVVTGNSSFLVDTGRHGRGPQLLEMMQSAGLSATDLDFVFISHGHEDHDGGLYDIVKAADLKIVAHRTYAPLMRPYPTYAPTPEKQDFPASCWRCFMPESFSSENCREYQQERERLKVTGLGDGLQHLGEGLTALHAPGHSPDASVLFVDDEAVIVGDTVLPDITSHPTQEAFFNDTVKVLQAEYGEAEDLYGLKTYIRSLGQLAASKENLIHPLLMPGHRLFHRGAWNVPDLSDRIGELVEHHIDRCAAILAILENGPKTASEIAERHFNSKLLKGMGIHMAVNEVLSHCELLADSGDVKLEHDRIIRTNGTCFESGIRDIFNQ